MDIVLWVILAAIFIILWILMWRRAGRFKKCRGCRHFAEQYITSLHGQGLFRFGYCKLVIYETPIVEPDIGRECDGYEVLEVLEDYAPRCEGDLRSGHVPLSQGRPGGQ